MKGKVAFSSHVEDLCHQIDKLTESLNQVMATNEKITSELVIVKKKFTLAKIAESLILKTYKPRLCNTIEEEISGISKEIPDDDLENNVIDICKSYNIINPADITVYHCDITALLVINLRS